MKPSIKHISLIAIALAALPAIASEETDEITALRQKVRLQEQQLKSVTARLDELEVPEATISPAVKSWVDKIKLKGDFRYRFEYVEKDDVSSKNRQRIRARIGAHAQVNDFTTACIQIRTGESANSGNETVGSDWDNKGVYVDLAYLTLAPFDSKYGSLTLGKMKYPWKLASDLIWDGDVNPEGIAYKYATKRKNTSLFASAGYFKIQESSSSHDMNLGTAQIGIKQPIGEKTTFTVGGSIYGFDNSTDFNDPDTSANYLVDYTIAELFSEITLSDVLPVPVKFYGNYVNNTEESNDNEGFCVGLKFGNKKKGKWEAKIDYRDLDTNAAPSYFVDSDFAGGGTDVKGGRIKTAYNISKNLQAGISLIAGTKKTTNTDVNTIHLDLIASF